MRLLLSPRTLWSFLCLCLSVSCLQSLFAQSHPVGSWNILNGKLSISQHWSVWAEGQMRSTKFFDDFYYYEAKGGLTYNINKSISITGGAGHYATYTQGDNFQKPLVTGENRTWIQLVMEQQLSRINFDHRYRAEQRHLTSGYKNRFRYRLNVIIPLNHPEMKTSTIYTFFGDEIFFTNKAPYYERNRLYAGLGYKVSPQLAIQSGYMRQFDYKIESHSFRNFVQLSLLFNFRLAEHVDRGVPKTTD